MSVGDVSLLHGAAPALLGIAALCTLAIAAIRPDPRWALRRLAPVVAVSFLVVVVVNWRLDLERQFDEVIPFQFLVWATLPVAALGIAVVGWRGDRRWRRIVSIVAVPLTAMYHGQPDQPVLRL